jgi:hypothetical protein
MGQQMGGRVFEAVICLFEAVNLQPWRPSA